MTTGEVRVRKQLQVVEKRLVFQELKTEKSRRTVSLPQVCIDDLRAHHTLPTLAAVLGVDTAVGIPTIVDEIESVLKSE